MNHSKRPLLYPLGVFASIVALGVLSACSVQPQDTETLAQGNDSTIVNMTDEDFDTTASRNHGAWGAVYMTQRELADPDRNIVNYSLIPAYDSDAEIAKWNEKFGSSNGFHSSDGAELYHDSCAGCHMHDGEGAFGAGYYPPLANNTKMSSKYYILDILINGFRGMPSFNTMMDNEQMAAVTQYVMSDLNGYTEEVTAADVAQIRPTVATESEGR